MKKRFLKGKLSAIAVTAALLVSSLSAVAAEPATVDAEKTTEEYVVSEEVASEETSIEDISITETSIEEILSEEAVEESNYEESEDTDSSAEITGVDVNVTGLKVSLKAKGTFDSSTTFKFLAYNFTTGTWTLVQNYSSSQEVSYIPSGKGDWMAYVVAKANDGTETNASSVFNYQGCTAELTDITVTSNSDHSLKLTENCKTNDTNIQYKWIQYDVSKGVWSMIQNWSGNNTTTWKPEHTGDYFVQVTAKTEDGTEKSNLIVYNVAGAKVTEFSVNLQNPHTLGNSVSIKANYVDALNEVVSSQILVFDGTGFTSLGKDVTSASWTPNAYGSYAILYILKDKNGNTIVQETKNVSVNKKQEAKPAPTVKPVDYSGYPAEERAMLNKSNNYASNTQYIILVNCSIHRVLICKGQQGAWQPIQWWQCADGKASTPTKKGVFTIQGKGKYFYSGNAICHYYSQFSGNYLFHSVLYYKKNPTKIMDGRVGMGLSHGCVRLQIDNAKWIYDNIPRGTKVVVY